VSNVYVAIYFTAFALIAGGAFALMWGNIQSINKLMDSPPPKPRHPEAPKPGETVMYVDLEKEKLEKLLDK
jgi:hypothetical protein